MKITVQEILTDALIGIGYSDEDAAMLLARFLEEETELYFDCMNDLNPAVSIKKGS